MMDDTRSIQELENDYWEDFDFPTGLVEKCHAYRKIPVADLSTEQIRLLLGQRIGVRFLLPKAIKILQSNILAEGDFYPGDLLSNVLRLKKDDWEHNLVLQQQFDSLLTASLSEIQSCEDKKLMRQVEDYQKTRLG